MHLIAAFDDVSARNPVRSMLTAGCGEGYSELFLALRHPEVEFTLTDVNAERVGLAARNVGAARIANVECRVLDLTSEPDGQKFDLVTSTEVLEHIGADDRAARHLLSLAAGHVWSLVPFCTESELSDERARRRAWERHEHHRPGYTFASLRQLFAQSQLIWERNCYIQPEAQQLRDEMRDNSDDELWRHRRAWVDAAVRDIDAAHRPDATAAGIEILTQAATPT